MPGSVAPPQAALSDDLAQLRVFHHAAYRPGRIAAERARQQLSVSVCLPARECGATVGHVVRSLCELREAGMIDEVVVVDAASVDGTAQIAREAGAAVRQEAELLPEFGPVLGKGDAMWRALSSLQGDLVCFLDADTEGFDSHFVTGLLGPLVCEPDVSFVKAFYRRPPVAGQATLDGGGGRVNALLARPALAVFYPELVGIRQPLAGEVAARRELLQRLPFATGYGVEIAMLLDAWREVGLGRIVQVDLEEHRHRHQTLADLEPMARAVLATVATRLQRDGRLLEGAAPAPAPLERPPLASLARA